MKLGDHMGKAKSEKHTKPHCLTVFNLKCQGLPLPQTFAILLMGHVSRYNDYLKGVLNRTHLQIILLASYNNYDQI